MVGETEENWQRNIEKTIALEPDSVTIYQMELPYNTTITKDILQKTGQMTGTVADWDEAPLGRGRLRGARARRLHIGSAYTAVKDPAKTQFVYRDRLWQGADMVGLGVASFGHVNGVHVQNMDTWEAYSEADRPRRAAAGPRLPADRRRADAARAGAADEARPPAAGLLRREVRRRHPAATSRRRSTSLRARGLPDAGGRRTAWR